MEEKVLLNATALFFLRGNEVLFEWKTRKINKDRWNGYGGGIEEGESPEETAVREAKEETGGVIVDPENLTKIAIVDFHNTMSDGRTFACRVHMYTTEKWKGKIEATEEMANPTWFKIDNLPFGDMPPADPDWLPLALAGKKLVAKAYLGPFQQKKLKETEIEFIDSFSERTKE